jgi:tripartite-type tricarboxylate transporter receptor subunit TctC
MNRKMNKKILGLFICAVAILSLSSIGATALAFPDKPVTILCIYSAGGSTDLSSRMIANSATESFGKPVMVMNRVGGRGYVGLSQVYNAKPDGYTLGVLASSGLVLGPHLRKPPFDPWKLTSITSYGFYNMMLAVKADAPWKTMKEFIEWMKKNPGKAKIATASPNMMSNIPLWMLGNQEKLDFKLVPFGGSGPSVVAALGGHAHAATVAGEAVPYILDGRMRGLCVYNAERFPKLPDVPTLREIGYHDIVVESRAVIVGTPGIPKNTVTILEETFKKAMDDKGFKRVMTV